MGYTMGDFRAEMRKRGVSKRGFEKGYLRKEKPKPKPKPAPKPRKPKEFVPCNIHRLHIVRVHADGSRSGCPMCDAMIEDLCRIQFQ